MSNIYSEEQVVHLMKAAVRNAKRFKDTDSEMLELIDLVEAHDDDYAEVRRVGQ